MSDACRYIMAWGIFCVLLCGAGSPTWAQDAPTSGDDLRAALTREIDALRAEAAALRAQRKAAAARHTKREAALREDLDIWRTRREAARREVRQLEAELRELDAALNSMPAPDEEGAQVLGQAPETLAQYGESHPPEDVAGKQPARLRWLFARAARVLENQGRIRVQEQAFFLPEGRRVQGRVAHIGAVGAVGAAADVGGALAPAPGADALQLVAPAPEAARAYVDGEADEAPVILYDPNDDRPIEVFEPEDDAETRRTWRDTIADAAPIGYVILALGALALVIGVVRAGGLIWMTRRERRVGEELLDRVHDEMHHTHDDCADHSEEIAVIEEMVDGRTSAVCRIVRQALAHRHLAIELYEESVQGALVLELGRVARGLSAMRAVAAVAPLLGLLGTVIGMIATFDALTTGGAGDPAALSGGIAQALATTQLGLMVAVPTLLFHSALRSWADRIEAYIEHVAIELSIHIQELIATPEPAHTHTHEEDG